MRARALRRWCLSLAAFFAVYFSLRTSRTAMNWLWYAVLSPLERGLGTLCGSLDVSVAEVLLLTALFSALIWLCNVPRRIAAARRRWVCALRQLLAAFLAVLTVYAGFCLLWGTGYNTDGFQGKSGLTAQPVTTGALDETARFFSRQLAACADEVPRDAHGVCTLNRRQVLARSGGALSVLRSEFPFLTEDAAPAKDFACSRALSVLRFTGFYFPFTGEANVNTDSPSAFLPATVCHELSHRQGFTAEEECNFIGILAAIRSDDPAYRYSGYLTGFTYLSNALYAADRDAWQSLRDTLPDTVVADLRASNDYWAQFRSAVSRAADRVYDGFLKSNGDADGIRSYGTVTDLLVAYFA